MRTRGRALNFCESLRERPVRAVAATTPNLSPTQLSPPERTAATMNDERGPSASLIRMWRVWRTTKEMMNDRVGCAEVFPSCEQWR
jgi:hypothetical protein